MSSSDDRLVNDAEAAEYLGVSPGTVRQWRYRGRGPAFIRVGGSLRGNVRYRVADLDEWIASHRVDPTANTGAVG